MSNKDKTHRANNRQGFTLIEILVVVMIIAILASLVGVAVLRKPGEAKVSAAKLQIQQFRTAVQLYKAEQGRLPSQEQGLEALVKKPTIDPVPENYPNDGYLETRQLPKDPWGHEYIYLAPGRQNESFEVLCYGGDGEPGGEGESVDLSSSNLTE